MLRDCSLYFLANFNRWALRKSFVPGSEVVVMIKNERVEKGQEEMWEGFAIVAFGQSRILLQVLVKK